MSTHSENKNSEKPEGTRPTPPAKVTSETLLRLFERLITRRQYSTQNTTASVGDNDIRTTTELIPIVDAVRVEECDEYRLRLAACVLEHLMVQVAYEERVNFPRGGEGLSLVPESS